MLKDICIPLFDMVMCLSEAMDFINPLLVNHHKKVAYISFSIAREMGLSIEEQNNLILAGLLHDSGALSLTERLNTMEFETDNSGHAEVGYYLLRSFEPFLYIANLVRYHHRPWDYGRGESQGKEKIPPGSHILHLADRISVLINNKKEILSQVDEIVEKTGKLTGSLFMPEAYDAFKRLSEKEYFWLDAASLKIISILSGRARLKTILLDIHGLVNLSKLFCQIIDFRSHFTATHTCGVAASAEIIAKLYGFSLRECKLMRVAGYLHDLGKLAVPVEILDKPAKLSREEFNVIRSHTYYTYRILSPVDNFDIINVWGSLHHERLDGSGYPFHLKAEDIPVGSRIMAVADVFTAITEDRPYRKGMSQEQTLATLERMVERSALDHSIVSLLKVNFNEINSFRSSAQDAAAEEYKDFSRLVKSFYRDRGN